MVAIKFKKDYEDKKKGDVIIASPFLASYLLSNGICERSNVIPTAAEIAAKRKEREAEMQIITEIEAEEKQKAKPGKK